jgi:uncharacterized membrane protein (DUF2068 family)
MSAPATRIAPWEDFVLRLIAIYKLFHALFFIAVGFGLLKLRHHNVVEVLNTYVLIPFNAYVYHLNPENRMVDWLLDRAGNVSPHMLFLLSWAAFFYAALFAAEGIGLYLRKHWAEYVVIIVTGSLLPLEIYELFHKLAWWKFAAVVGNLFVVGYLVHRLLLDARFKALQHEAQDKDEKPPQPPASQRSKAVITKVSE